MAEHSARNVQTVEVGERILVVSYVDESFRVPATPRSHAWVPAMANEGIAKTVVASRIDQAEVHGGRVGETYECVILDLDDGACLVSTENRKIYVAG